MAYVHPNSPPAPPAISSGEYYHNSLASGPNNRSAETGVPV